VMGQVLRYEGINDGGMPVVDHIDPLSVAADMRSVPSGRV